METPRERDTIDVLGGSPLLSSTAGMPALKTRLLLAFLVTTIVLFVLFTPWPLYNKLHAIGRACCAQIPSHTIRFDGQPMPIDARNSGIYLGVFQVIAMLWLTGRQRAGLWLPVPLRNLLLGLVAAMVLDGFNSLQHTQHLKGLYPDSNEMRIVTGTLSGMALTILVVPLFNRVVWREPETIAIADDWTDLFGYLVGAFLIVLALSQAPPTLFWPLSILSIAGVLITLTMVNTATILVSTRRENSVGDTRELIIPALAGLALTCCEIAAIDLWRVLAHR